MDHRNGTPHPIHRFDLNELPLISRHSIRKRKLPPELVGLPSKYKFRDPRHVSDDESGEDGVVEDEDIPHICVEWRDNKPVADGLKQSVDSTEESSSLTSLCAAAMSQDAGSRTEILMDEAAYHDQPSYSSDSYDSNNFYADGNSPQSMDCKNPGNARAKGQALFGCKLVEDVIRLEPGNSDELLEVDVLNDHIPSESESNEIEQQAGEQDEDSVLYLDRISTNISSTSTGRWDMTFHFNCSHCKSLIQ